MKLESFWGLTYNSSKTPPQIPVLFSLVRPLQDISESFTALWKWKQIGIVRVALFSGIGTKNLYFSWRFLN